MHDRHGNLLTVSTGGGGPSAMNVTVDASTNRVNGWTYDANGNVTAMPGGISGGVYDIENRLMEASKNGAMKYGYGADNRRIFESKRKIVAGGGDTIEEVVTWWSGQRIGRYKIRWNDQAPNNGAPNSFVFARLEQENIWFGSRPLTLGGETNVSVDRLGSVRRSGRDYFPYGQEAPSTTTGGKEKYGTYRHDGETDLSYADQRYYATGAGRFMSADPYKASAGASEPGSWNRYTYVDGDAVNWRDPVGLAAAPPDSGRDYGGSGGGGGFGDPSVVVTQYYDSEGYLGGAASFLPGGGGGGQGGSGAGGGSGASGPMDRLRKLLAESLERVKNLLTDDCAKAVGAKNGAQAIAKLKKTGIDFADLGVLKYETKNGVMKGAEGSVHSQEISESRSLEIFDSIAVLTGRT